MGEAAEGRCFTVFCGIYWPDENLADFSPSYSWVDFGEPFRRPTQKKHSQALSRGVQNQLGASKNAVKQKNTPLSLWDSTAPGCPGALAASPAWVNMSTGSAAGGWPDADIHLGDMLGSFRDRFGTILE